MAERVPCQCGEAVGPGILGVSHRAIPGPDRVTRPPVGGTGLVKKLRRQAAGALGGIAIAFGVAGCAVHLNGFVRPLAEGSGTRLTTLEGVEYRLRAQNSKPGWKWNVAEDVRVKRPPAGAAGGR